MFTGCRALALMEARRALVVRMRLSVLMIDSHCHILRGLDDGPETLEESVAMCRIAYEDGIGTIVATPHFRPGNYEHPYELIRSRIEELSHALRREGMPIVILPGADVTITPELDEHLERFAYLTINGTGKYFLAEFPGASVPPKWDVFLLGVIRKGLVPIITHPERNGWFLSHPDALEAFVREGGFVQVTAMSLTGGFGPAAREYCEYLVRHNVVHIIASDAHSSTQRLPVLSAAVRRAKKWIGEEQALKLVRDTPRAVLGGLPVEQPAPAQRSSKRRWMKMLGG